MWVAMVDRRQTSWLAAGLLALGLGLALATSLGCGKEETEPVQVPDSWREMREGKGHKIHLRTDVKCKDCHQVKEGVFLIPSDDVCSRCHERTHEELHGVISIAGAVRCRDCHSFKTGDPEPGVACRKCHVKEPEASHVGPERVVAVHASEACTTCHKPHSTQRPAGFDCVDCHRDREAAHGQSGSTPDGCLECHGAHRPAEAAKTGCVRCHVAGDVAPQAPAPTLDGGIRLDERIGTTSIAFPAGAFKGRAAPHVPATALTGAGQHATCATCHRPHGDDRGVLPCGSCHGDQVKHGAGTSLLRPDKVDHTCTACHPQHQVKGAQDRCAQCHDSVEKRHPGDCTGCHQPHAPEGSKPLACASCHDPRDPKPALTTVAALADPVADTRAHSGGIECLKCHSPHGSQESPKPCWTCHAKEAAGTQSIKERGHADCKQCHLSAAHDPQRKPPACGTCHQAEAASAPEGHADCKKCHEPHGGKQRPEAACRKCHDDEARTPHGKADCASCHRPHGPEGVATAPACATCHTPQGLGGLHRKPGHDSCASCHLSSHGPYLKAARATCIGPCHQDKQDHEPNAKVCSGCHLFR